MSGQCCSAVVSSSSFAFYEKCYYLIKVVPDLVIYFVHDSVLAVECLSLMSGRIAMPYDLAGGITDVEMQRHRSKTGSQMLLGIYLCGMKDAQAIIRTFRLGHVDVFLSAQESWASAPVIVQL